MSQVQNTLFSSQIPAPTTATQLIYPQANVLPLSDLRVLLAAVSPYFRAMFTSPLVESRLNEIRLLEVTPMVMDIVIQFVYTGEAGLSLDTAEDIFVAANRLQVMPLQELCSR